MQTCAANLEDWTVSTRRMFLVHTAALLATGATTWSARATVPNALFTNVEILALSVIYVGESRFAHIFDLRAISTRVADFIKGRLEKSGSKIHLVLRTSGEQVPANTPANSVLGMLLQVSAAAAIVDGKEIVVGSLGIAGRRQRHEMHMEEMAPALFVINPAKSSASDIIVEAAVDLFDSGILQTLIDAETSEN